MTAGKPGAQNVVLRLNRITKRFGTLTANDSVSFDLKRGEVIALLGENGAGKTTLTNILFGLYTADEGTVEVFGRPLPPGQPRAALEAGVGMVHQHFTLAENLTVLENITLGSEPLSGLRQARRRAKAKLQALSDDYGLTVPLDAKISTLTVGEKQRVEILKALYRDVKILILDEPTAVLTPQEADALFATLRKTLAHGLSVIFISHKLHEVMAISSRVLVLRHGMLVAEVATSDTDPVEIASLMVGGEVSAPKAAPGIPGAALVNCKAVSTPDEGNAPGLKSIDLTLHAGQITGLAGVSGNGQAALADLIGGLIRPATGEFYVHGTAPANWSPRQALSNGVGRIPEDRHKTGTVSDMDLTENAVLESYSTTYSRFGWMNHGAARAHTSEIIAQYDVRCPGPDTPIRLLSGGNMQKLILGRALATAPDIILANQPVRGLDIGAVNYVHSQLIEARDRGSAVLLISEDLDEILSLSDVIHVISEGRLSPPFARGSMTQAQLGIWMAGQGFNTQSAGAINAA